MNVHVNEAPHQAAFDFREDGGIDDGLLCANGQPTARGSIFAPGWSGPHHCAGCAAELERSCQAFAEAVVRGEYDEDGYTPAERRAQRRKEQQRHDGAS